MKKITILKVSVTIEDTDIQDACYALSIPAEFSDPPTESELTTARNALKDYLQEQVIKIASPVVNYKLRKREAEIGAYLRGVLSNVVSTEYLTDEITD